MNIHPCYKYRFFLIPLATAGFLALFTFAVYALWNGVLTDVLGVKTITYWQALGLLVLAKILFGGFPGRGRGCGFGPPWRERMLAKRWASLPPDQREHFREEARHRFGDWPRRPWEKPEDTSPDAPSKPPGA
jgi:hypothetical protein